MSLFDRSCWQRNSSAELWRRMNRKMDYLVLESWKGPTRIGHTDCETSNWRVWSIWRRIVGFIWSVRMTVLLRSSPQNRDRISGDGNPNDNLSCKNGTGDHLCPSGLQTSILEFPWRSERIGISLKKEWKTTEFPTVPIRKRLLFFQTIQACPKHVVWTHESCLELGDNQQRQSNNNKIETWECNRNSCQSLMKNRELRESFMPFRAAGLSPNLPIRIISSRHALFPLSSSFSPSIEPESQFSIFFGSPPWFSAASSISLRDESVAHYFSTVPIMSSGGNAIGSVLPAW
jgi:hypothetical protein